MTQNSDSHPGIALAALVAVGIPLAGFVGLIVLLITVIAPPSSASCSAGVGVQSVSVPAGLSRQAGELWGKPLNMQPGHWYPVGATEYDAGDGTGSGNFGSIPDPAEANLDEHPDSYAELSLLPSNPANDGGTLTFANANALGNLPYMTGLRVARDGKGIIVYKRDTGYGQGPAEHTPEGFQYRIDLWGPAAQALGVSKNQVDIQLAPKTGAGELLEAIPTGTLESTGEASDEGSGSGCGASAGREGPLPLTAGESAKVLPDGLAAAPREAPRAVKAMIAAGNRLDHASYLYGGGHGPSLNTLQPAYDCSSSVSYVLHAGGVFGEFAQDSTELESYGEPGPGKWVSVYANSEHAFMYVAGIRFDTSYNGTDTGPNEGKSGPRWRVFDEVPKWAQWVVRHPPGL
ncbi:MAG: hypothetical protein ABSH36_04515 [Solirubrobacteraceae bacterium]